MSAKRKIDESVDSFERAVLRNLYYTRGSAVESASARDVYVALAYTVRDCLIDRWADTTRAHYQANPKFVYYLSAEYLLGKQLAQNLFYTGNSDIAREALQRHGIDLDRLQKLEAEPGLGNGGLGRLAACFLDSLATLDIPAMGYGIRYEYGIFRQAFQDGWQQEIPDDWLLNINPWEFPQPDTLVKVGFRGLTEFYNDSNGHTRVRWLPGETVLGEPYHTLVPGFATRTVNMLRLWRARAEKSFDFRLFDAGDYVRAVEQNVYSENLSRVLYPNDGTAQGRELRLKQQYFFVACSLKDIIRRFQLRNDDWDAFPDKVAIQLNDTHPVIAIPELMRILVDEQQLEWERAWRITRRSIAYTCHTLLPEALEKWPVELIAELLPRHLEIIFEINQRFIEKLMKDYPEEPERWARMSIIEEGVQKKIRMAHLACVGSFTVNGVAELHSRLLQSRTLRDFAELDPHRFQNKTNGVTPRRFMALANPRLSQLITERIGEGWLADLTRLEALAARAEDPDLQAQWQAVKQANKADLAEFIQQTLDITVNPNSMFDVMVKRLHEYKRQLLKALHILTLYLRIKDDPSRELVPRTFIFGAKAAPAYRMAKRIIKLINNAAALINSDADVADRLKVVFLPNFNVTLAQRIYPAADLSEQISMAGKEASGTGNMKFALNGALTVGTLDGANVEIRERVGAENFFLFGHSVEEVQELKAGNYQPRHYYDSQPELRRVLDFLASETLDQSPHRLFQPIIRSLLNQDEYLVLADYEAYIQCQERVAAAFGEPERWTAMAIRNVARCGFFSSDRTIRAYCEEIWNVHPVQVSQNSDI
jgi:starch phosphorylase